MATERNIVLEIKNLCHRFVEKSVLFDITLQVQAGEIVGLVGPSGCGKSTLLRAIVGTHPPTEGSVYAYDIEGKNPIRVEKPSRDIGIVYQKYSLFQFLTAVENVAFGLMLDESAIWDRSLFLRWMPFYRQRRCKHLSWAKLKNYHLDEAAALLGKLGLAEAMHHYPHELSGGMCQRVAIAQALIMKPRILLLDEPFGALDEANREELQQMLLELYAENVKTKNEEKASPYTIIFVTHALDEAILVSDRVVGLSQFWDSSVESDPYARGAATKVYDEVAPVFTPDQEYSYEMFLKQREEIRHAVFDPQVLQKRDKFNIFWKQVREGKGEGVLENE